MALVRRFSEASARPPIIFGSTDNLGYSDYNVAWAILYRRFKKSGISKDTAMEALRHILMVVDASFVYRRWDDDTQTYKKFLASGVSYEVRKVDASELDDD